MNEVRYCLKDGAVERREVLTEVQVPAKGLFLQDYLRIVEEDARRMLVRERILEDMAQRQDAVAASAESKASGEQPCLQVEFWDDHDSLVPYAADDVFWRLKSEFGWGRPFNYAPGKLVGRSLARGGEVAIICKMALYEEGSPDASSKGILGWRVEEDYGISYAELSELYRVVDAHRALIITEEHFPQLFS